MATGTKEKATESTVSELFASMEVEESIHVPLRGRGLDPDVIKIREELEKMLTEGTARSFPNVEADKREFYARKVRSAGAMKTESLGEEIKVTTRYDKNTKKLIWGPDSVLKALVAK